MNRIKELCARRGITQKELVSLVGTSQPTVSDWFSQKKNPTGERMKKLCEVLKVGRGVILGYDPDPLDPLNGLAAVEKRLMDGVPSAHLTGLHRMAFEILTDNNIVRAYNFEPSVDQQKEALIINIMNKFLDLDEEGQKQTEQFIDFILSQREQK